MRTCFQLSVLCAVFCVAVGSGSKTEIASVNRVLQSWSTEIQQNGGTMTHGQAVYREGEVVRRIDQGLWPMEAYHQYQAIAAGSGNVDSARLLIAYSLQPVMQRFIDTPEEHRLQYACATCNLSLLRKVLDEYMGHVDAGDDDEAVTALMVASYFDCVDAIVVLISEGADVNIYARNGMTALMIASSLGRVGAIGALASAGHINVNARHKFAGTTALHMAAEVNQSAAIEALCKSGADASLTTSLGSTALHVAAATNAHLSIAPLLSACEIEPNALMNNDTTALYLAALHGYTAFVMELLKHGANASYHMPTSTQTDFKQLSSNRLDEATIELNSEPANGAEAIHAAAENGHLPVVKVLLKFGADIDTVSIGVSPLHLAVQYNQVDIVRYLLRKGAEVDKPSLIDNTTPLYFAAGSGNNNLVSVLLEAGASCLAINNLDSFPLLYAVAAGREKVVRKMLTLPNLSPDFCTPSGVTALHVACSFGHTGIVTQLFNKGSDVTATTAVEGDTPLHLASRYGHLDVVEKIFKHIQKNMSEDERSQYVNKKSIAGGFSPFLYAVQRERNSLNFIDLISRLLRNGADVNARVSEGAVAGATALYIAATNGDSDLVKLLIEGGADPNIPLEISRGGFTPLLAAIDRGFVDTVRALLTPNEHGGMVRTDPNLGNGRSWTQSPVLYAVIKGYSEIVDLLLSAGGDCTIQIAISRKNDPPEALPAPQSLQDLAQHYRHYDVLQTLHHHESCRGNVGKGVTGDL